MSSQTLIPKTDTDNLDADVEGGEKVRSNVKGRLPFIISAIVLVSVPAIFAFRALHQPPTDTPDISHLESTPTFDAWEWPSSTGCDPRALADYSYPSGGKTNLVPMISLLVQDRAGLDIIPSNSASSPSGPPVGKWKKTWTGYVYVDDINEMALMSMTRKGSSFSINRCDEFKTVIVKEESGGNDKIYIDGKLVAYARRVTQDVRSYTMRLPNSASEEIGSGMLIGRDFHGERKDVWIVQSAPSSPLPYYIINAATAMFAFKIADQRGEVDAMSSMRHLEQSEATPQQRTLEENAAAIKSLREQLAQKSEQTNFAKEALE